MRSKKLENILDGIRINSRNLGDDIASLLTNSCNISPLVISKQMQSKQGQGNAVWKIQN